MSFQQFTQLTQRHQVATLPPSHPKFKHLDSLLIALEEQPLQPRKAVLKLRRRWIERVVPAFVTHQRTGVRP
ncbi:MAG: hypothetical protein M3R24_00840 [Chloroflexota bacterium]|nr:hypothetical protein [Chloroflexota bacterium]